MVRLPTDEASFWTASTSAEHHYSLNGDITVDTAIIGGGIAGLTAAYLLKNAGQRVAVLEKNTVGSGVSGHTTGKVTSGHGLIYNELVRRHGIKRAKIYGAANEAAIRQIASIVRTEKIDCDLQRDNNYIFTENSEELAKIKQEVTVAQKLDLPATYVTETPLPFAVKGAIRYENQAKLHIRKYLLGLATAVHGNGSVIYEDTRATRVIDGAQCRVKTKHGTVTANHVIIATNVPFSLTSHGAYCILEYPQKSYIIASHNETKLTGMYITAGSPTRSILPVKSGPDEMLLIGGEGHIPGLGGNVMRRYEKLADYSRTHFNTELVDYRWSARDYLSYDSMPLVGKLYPWSKNVLVATAFMKWGLTNGTMAGKILSDLILGQKNGWFDNFNSNRGAPIKAIPHVFAKYTHLSR